MTAADTVAMVAAAVDCPATAALCKVDATVARGAAAEEVKDVMLLANGAAMGAAAEYMEPAADVATEAAAAAAEAAADSPEETRSVGLPSADTCSCCCCFVAVMGSTLDMTCIAADSSTLEEPDDSSSSLLMEITKGTYAAVASPSTMACSGDACGERGTKLHANEDVTRRRSWRRRRLSGVNAFMKYVNALRLLSMRT
jgi:hypothetical protein